MIVDEISNDQNLSYLEIAKSTVSHYFNLSTNTFCLIDINNSFNAKIGSIL